MRFINTLLPVLFALTTPALAQGQITVPTSPRTTATDNPAASGAGASNKVICRTYDVTGSRLTKRRECHTQAEWTEIAALERRELDKQQANRYKGNQ